MISVRAAIEDAVIAALESGADLTHRAIEVIVPWSVLIAFGDIWLELGGAVVHLIAEDLADLREMPQWH